MPAQKANVEFLPAVLEIQESPPSPIGRVISWSIVLLFAITLTWAFYGEVDIVAVAQGKIIAGGKDKVIQPLETGVVKAIYVKEGQHVQQGDALIQLDTTMSEADQIRIEQELNTARLDVIRLTELIRRVQEHDHLPVNPFEARENTDAESLLLQEQLLNSQQMEYQARLNNLGGQLQELNARKNVIEKGLNKLNATLPIVEERVKALKALNAKNLASKHEYLQLEQQRVEQKHDIETQKAQIQEIEAAQRSVENNKLAYQAEFARNLITESNNAQRSIAALEQELQKSSQRNRLHTLTAPIDGEIQQLDIHTEGGVVTSAQPLMIIVPSDNKLEVEALLPNKDIGFVREQQSAEVKIEAFPFTKYGVINAHIENVSRDAIADEYLGLVYKTTAQLESNTIVVEDKRVNLVPGMAVTLEVKTGKRRMIEYFLSPIMQYQDESIRER